VGRSTAARTRLSGLPLFGFAIAGLVAGHAIAYRFAVPDGYHRDLVLARTGHGYLPSLTELAVVLVLAAGASIVGRALRRDAEQPTRVASIAVRLAVLQLVAFTGQELIERLLAHVPIAELVRDHVLAIGALAQIAVAIVGALVLRLLIRAANAASEIVAARAVRPRLAIVGSLASWHRPLRRRLVAPSLTVRGPPLG
jgi:hypothetical protein